MNILPSAKNVKLGRPTYRKVYRTTGERVEIQFPRGREGGSVPIVHGGVKVNSIPDEFRGITAERYSAAPGVPFEKAVYEG